MRIQDMFEKGIDRPINGVVKVNQDELDILVQELDEYVITRELKKHIITFFNNYLESFHAPTADIGVWISGFFGSGKSHFLKMLSYLLQNRDVNDVRTVERFRHKPELVDDPATFMLIDQATSSGHTDSLIEPAGKQKDKNEVPQMKIYIAAPLFSEGERAFNEKVDAVVRACGHETFLPQREGGCVADLPDIIEGMPKRKYLFRLDCTHMDWCDAVLFLFDGRVPDEGACFELGYCYAKGKRCIAYKTDARSFIDGFDNVMLCGAPEAVLRNETELRDYLMKL